MAFAANTSPPPDWIRTLIFFLSPRLFNSLIKFRYVTQSSLHQSSSDEIVPNNCNSALSPPESTKFQNLLFVWEAVAGTALINRAGLVFFSIFLFLLFCDCFRALNRYKAGFLHHFAFPCKLRDICFEVAAGQFDGFLLPG